MPDRPNLLLICTDNQRRDTLGCYGSKLGNTPRIDRLAQEGIVFDHAYTASPVCGPARSSLLTGLHALSHGAIENGFEREPDLITLPDVLQAQGYRCLMAGKTHFGPVPDSFEHVSEGPDVADVGGYPQRDAAVVDEALAWLDEGDERPFFLFLSLHMPHEPFQPTHEAMEAINRTCMPRLNANPHDLDRQPAYLREDMGIPHESPQELSQFYPDGSPDVEQIDRERRRYYALSSMIDHEVGRVLDHIEQHGDGDDTLTVFTSDHGSTLYDRGFKDKHCFYDEVWRVPLIIHQPSRLRPRRETGPTSWIDLTSTLAAAAKGETSEFQGFDLMDALLSEADWPRHAVPASVFHTLAMTTHQWTIEYDTLRHTGQIFDRVDDPLQRSDRWSDDQCERVRDSLLGALLGWRASLHSPQQSRRRYGQGGPVAKKVVEADRQVPANHADTTLQRFDLWPIPRA